MLLSKTYVLFALATTQAVIAVVNPIVGPDCSSGLVCCNSIAAPANVLGIPLQLPYVATGCTAMPNAEIAAVTWYVLGCPTCRMYEILITVLGQWWTSSMLRAHTTHST